METRRLEDARRDPLVLELGSTVSTVMSMLGMTANGLSSDLRKRRDATLDPMPDVEFDLLGYDYSVTLVGDPAGTEADLNA